MNAHRLAAGLAVASLLALAGCGDADRRPPVSPPPATAEQIERGRYLAAAADCMACHTAADGLPYAGGAPIETPFGTLYGTNITPAPDTGIGRWTADDFFRALREGKAPGGRHLYPAMPYTAYRFIAREDSDAMYAYFMRLPPVEQRNREHELPFPLNLRFTLSVWNALFVPEERPAASQGGSAPWQRGRYLVEALGHCGECHTPRGMLGQMKMDQPLAGYALTRLAAPDVTPDGLAGRGWTNDDVIAYLRTGLSRRGSAGGDMYEVVVHSTQHLTDDDLQAMATYLFGDRAPQARVSVPPVGGVGDHPGRAVYLYACSACHGHDGEGIPHVASPLRTNSLVALPNPRNLLVKTLDGVPARDFPGLERRQEMPAFDGLLSDRELANLATYLRSAWGGRAEPVVPERIAELRERER